MVRVAWRSVRAHARQFVLTALAVVLGVAFLSGTLALRGVLSDTFSALTSSTMTRDLYVSGEPVEGTEGTASFVTQPLDSSLAQVVGEVDGVDVANPATSLIGVLVAADDTPVTSSGAPTLLLPIFDQEPGLTWVQGRAPSGEGEIVLESAALERSSLAVGDTTHVVVQGEPREVTVVGEFTYGTSMAGATLVGMDDDWLLPLAAPDGQVSQIAVTVEDGASVTEVRDAVAEVLPDGVRVQTRQESIDEQNEYIESLLGFAQTFLLVFVVLAMFVGSFIIMNSFAMSVRQRQKEFALLRAVGASPASVFGTVFLQAVIIGLAGSLLGVAAGAGLLQGIVALLEAAGMPLTDGISMSGGVVVTSVVVGLLVTVVGALLPARDAALTHPVEAMRDVSGAREKSLVLRTVIGGLLLAAGTAAVTAAWVNEGLEQRTLVLGLGAGGVILGLLTVSPVLARPVVSLLGLPFRALRPSGRLAVRNIIHNPRRTANTSGALMVGMALVCAGATIAASTNSSVSDAVNDSMKADFLIQPASATTVSAQIPSGIATDLGEIDGVAGTAPFVYASVSATAEDSFQEPMAGLNVSDSLAFLEAYDLEVTEGDMADLDSTHVAAYRSTELHVGDTVTLTGPLGAVEATVAAVIDPQGLSGSFSAPPELAVELGSWTGALPTDPDQVLASPSGTFLTLEEGADADQVRREAEDILAPTYQYAVLDADELSDMVGQQVNQILAILYGLLGLSIVIAVLGIVNTLVLSVAERTREIGLMRAVGLGRAQLGGEVMVESVLTSLYGTVVGGAAGLLLAAALRAVLEDDGLTTLTIPWGQMVGMLVLSVVVGVVAAVWPAMRASRLPVLDAIATE
ncbi:ABC transporter permease [Actinomyces sp. 2119]|uniref:ABC transporter permease n=1 Tax=Actinomyces sp. 2119 TaxID=2321393 RepID=UPI000E6D3917|nr:ABC transporter permease [Actinomyces sp. 2119]RJF41924.1 ABC transporter permease [Actinomyces sp. 2119]